MIQSRKYLVLAAFSYLLAIAPLLSAQAQETNKLQEVPSAAQTQMGKQRGMQRMQGEQLLMKTIAPELLAEIKEAAKGVSEEISALREKEENERKALHKFLSEDEFNKDAYLAAHKKSQELHAEMGAKRAAFIAKFAPKLQPIQRIILPKMLQNDKRRGRKSGRDDKGMRPRMNQEK